MSDLDVPSGECIHCNRPIYRPGPAWIHSHNFMAACDSSVAFGTVATPQETS